MLCFGLNHRSHHLFIKSRTSVDFIFVRLVLWLWFDATFTAKMFELRSNNEQQIAIPNKKKPKALKIQKHLLCMWMHIWKSHLAINKEYEFVYGSCYMRKVFVFFFAAFVTFGCVFVLEREIQTCERHSRFSFFRTKE